MQYQYVVTFTNGTSQVYSNEYEARAAVTRNAGSALQKVAK